MGSPLSCVYFCIYSSKEPHGSISRVRALLHGNGGIIPLAVPQVCHGWFSPITLRIRPFLVVAAKEQQEQRGFGSVWPQMLPRNCSSSTGATNQSLGPYTAKGSVSPLGTLQNGAKACLRHTTSGHELRVILLSPASVMAYSWDIWFNVKYTHPGQDTWPRATLRRVTIPLSCA